MCGSLVGCLNPTAKLQSLRLCLLQTVLVFAKGRPFVLCKASVKKLFCYSEPFFGVSIIPPCLTRLPSLPNRQTGDIKFQKGGSLQPQLFEFKPPFKEIRPAAFGVYYACGACHAFFQPATVVTPLYHR